MKKRILGKKLSRSRTARTALYRGLVKALAERGAIKTTMAKAKALDREVNKLMSIALEDNLSTRKRLTSKLANDNVTAAILFDKVTQGSRKGGFTRVIPLPSRRGDQAAMARIEFVDKNTIAKKIIAEKPAVKEKKEDKKTKAKSPTVKKEIKKDKQ